MANLKRIR